MSIAARGRRRRGEGGEGGGQLSPPLGGSFDAGTHAPPSTGTHPAFASSKLFMTSPDLALDNRSHPRHTGAGYEPDETFLRVSCAGRNSFLCGDWKVPSRLSINIDASYQLGGPR